MKNILRHTTGTTTDAGFIGIISSMLGGDPRLADQTCTAICYEDLCIVLNRFKDEITDQDCTELVDILCEFKGEDFTIYPRYSGCPTMRVNNSSRLATAAAIKTGVDAIRDDGPWMRDQDVAVME